MAALASAIDESLLQKLLTILRRVDPALDTIFVHTTTLENTMHF